MSPDRPPDFVFDLGGPTHDAIAGIRARLEGLSIAKEQADFGASVMDIVSAYFSDVPVLLALLDDMEARCSAAEEEA